MNRFYHNTILVLFCFLTIHDEYRSHMKAISSEKWKSSLSKNQIWTGNLFVRKEKFGRFEIGINSEFDSFRKIHRSSASREYEASFAREQSWSERSPRLKMSTRCWCDWRSSWSDTDREDAKRWVWQYQYHNYLSSVQQSYVLQVIDAIRTRQFWKILTFT